MPAYRFCRPDDIPFLVRAIDECYNVHFRDEPAMTLERFRTEMKELDVWPSNSMVARAGEDPIAVLIGTKREQEVRVLRIGVRPGHQRQGHGSHILASLSQKLAVLGPSRLVIEAPRALAGVADFVRAAGYEYEATYVDWLRKPGVAEPVPEGLVIPTHVRELVAGEVLEVPEDVAWERARKTLLNRELEGLAIASPIRVEAYILYRCAQSADAVDIFAAGCVDIDRRELFLGLLFRALAAKKSGLPIRLPRLASGELPREFLEAVGFEAGEKIDRFATVASPG